MDITYHAERRGTRILPLRSYSNQVTDDPFLSGLDYFDFRFINVRIYAQRFHRLSTLSF